MNFTENESEKKLRGVYYKLLDLKHKTAVLCISPYSACGFPREGCQGFYRL